MDLAAIKRPFAEALGQYRLCLKIASGSTSVIYLAMFRGTDGLQRPVVIKRIHPYLANRLECVETFFDEAQLAAMVSHPAVCVLYDFGRSKDTYFLAMEYLVGETFERVTKQMRALKDSTQLARMPHYVARLAADVCEGLHAVHGASDTSGHSLQMVHGDITPRNVFALYDGSVRLTDFGSARSRDRAEQVGMGLGKGKVAYLSPEQLGHRSVDRRSDVWSFGVVLWEMLTQQSLFAADNVSATVKAVQTFKIPAPSSKNPFVPTDLDAVVMKALARSPEGRFATAREMALALESFLSSRKDTVAPADLTAWLETLLPGEAERRREMVRVARGMVEASHAAPPPLKAKGPAGVQVSSGAPANDNTASRARLVSQRRWKRPLTAAAVALLVVAVAGLAYYLGDSGAEPTALPTAAQPQETQ